MKRKFVEDAVTWVLNRNTCVTTFAEKYFRSKERLLSEVHDSKQEKRERLNIITTIPEELMEIIVSFLDQNSVAKLGETCKRFTDVKGLRKLSLIQMSLRYDWLWFAKKQTACDTLIIRFDTKDYMQQLFTNLEKLEIKHLRLEYFMETRTTEFPFIHWKLDDIYIHSYGFDAGYVMQWINNTFETVPGRVTIVTTARPSLESTYVGVDDRTLVQFRKLELIVSTIQCESLTLILTDTCLPGIKRIRKGSIIVLRENDVLKNFAASLLESITGPSSICLDVRNYSFNMTLDLIREPRRFTLTTHHHGTQTQVL